MRLVLLVVIVRKMHIGLPHFEALSKLRFILQVLLAMLVCPPSELCQWAVLQSYANVTLLLASWAQLGLLQLCRTARPGRQAGSQTKHAGAERFHAQRPFRSNTQAHRVMHR